MSEEIRARFIFEMLGKPSEYVKESLEEFINVIGKREGVKVIEKKIHEPKPVEKESSRGLFTSFAEVEITVDNLNLLFLVVLNLLPSHIEILEPREFKLKNFDLSAIITDLAIKLHKYDEIAKILMLEKNQLINQIKVMEKNKGQKNVGKKSNKEGKTKKSK